MSQGNFKLGIASWSGQSRDRYKALRPCADNCDFPRLCRGLPSAPGHCCICEM